MSSYDVTSSICQALEGGATWVASAARIQFQPPAAAAAGAATWPSAGAAARAAPAPPGKPDWLIEGAAAALPSSGGVIQFYRSARGVVFASKSHDAGLTW